MDKVIKKILATHGYTIEEAESILNNVGRAIFKAGMEEGAKEAYECGVYNGKADGIAEGIKEVVEWIENNFLKRVVSEMEWETQKKKWGVK